MTVGVRSSFTHPSSVTDTMHDHALPYPSPFHAFAAIVARQPQSTAIRERDRSIRYDELMAAGRQAGRALIAAGVGAGERIAIWAVNHSDWVIAALGIQAAGGTLIPASTRLKAREVAMSLRRARTTTLFCDPGFGSEDFVAGILAQDLPDLRRIVVFGDISDSERVTSWATFLSTGTDSLETALDARIAALEPEGLADIIFTSGTTGLPKGVPMTNGQSLIACEQQQRCVARFAAGDIFAITYPFAHNAGYRAGWQAAIVFGVTIVILHTLEAQSVLEAIARERVTVLPAVPTVYQAMLDHPDFARFDTSSIRFASTGATTIPVPLIEAMQDAFGLSAVVAGYGLTEAAGSVSSTQPGDSALVIATTTGQPLDNLEVKLIDSEGLVVPTGTPGEIVVRGPQVMRGYFEDEAATAAAFTADGFLRTGDVGVFDAAGNLAITDRLKDMYIVGGFNTYPAEIEQQLCRIEGVIEAAVIGIDDPRLGQVGRAFVVIRAGAPIDEAGIVAWCRAEMANYKVPRVVTFVETLPRNPTGKVSKVALRDMA